MFRISCAAPLQSPDDFWRLAARGSYPARFWRQIAAGQELPRPKSFFAKMGAAIGPVLAATLPSVAPVEVERFNCCAGPIPNADMVGGPVFFMAFGPFRDLHSRESRMVSLSC